MVKLEHNVFNAHSKTFEKEVLKLFPENNFNVKLEARGFSRRGDKKGVVIININKEILELKGEATDSTHFWIRNAVLNTLRENEEQIKEYYL